MDRRDMLLSLSATLALPFVGEDGILAFGEGLHRSTAAGGAFQALDLAEQQLVTALADRVLPATSTPGALDVGVPLFIDRMLAEWYEPADATRMRADLGAIDDEARRVSGAVLASLPEPAQVELLQRLDADESSASAASRGFRQFKSLIVFAYFTSERVAKEVLRTQIIFPDYDGCAPMNG